MVGQKAAERLEKRRKSPNYPLPHKEGIIKGT